MERSTFSKQLPKLQIKGLPIKLKNITKNVTLDEQANAQKNYLNKYSFKAEHRIIESDVDKNSKEFMVKQERIKKKCDNYVKKYRLLKKLTFKKEQPDDNMIQKDHRLKNIMLTRIKGKSAVRIIIPNSMRHYYLHNKRGVNLERCRKILYGKLFLTTKNKPRNTTKCKTTLDNNIKNKCKFNTTNLLADDSNEISNSNDSCDTVIVNDCNNDYSFIYDNLK